MRLRNEHPDHPVGEATVRRYVQERKRELGPDVLNMYAWLMTKVRQAKRLVLPKEAINAAHLFRANIATSHGAVNRVLCAVRLPEQPEEKIVVDFYPSVKQAQALQIVPSFRMYGKYEVSNVAYTIEAKEVWSTPISSGHKDGISFFSTFQGTPTEVRIITTLDQRRGKYLARGVFRLTDYPIFNAASIIRRSYTGNVRVRRVVVPTFTLKSGVRLMLKDHFDAIERRQGETTTTSHLVAEFKATKRIPVGSFPAIEDDLNRFLRLASFAARYRCLCTSWLYSDDGSSHVQHYYQNLTIPKGRIPSTNETLVDIAVFPKFIRTAYLTYSCSSQTDLLDNAIYALLNERATIEDRFTKVFSGLQSLLWFVYRNGGSTGTRIPIKKLFEVFVNSYNVKLDDLWPLFDSSSGPSLYDIRNAIAHGEFLDPGKFMSLSYAQENLNWTVERILLVILGWPIEQSKVKAEFLHSWSLAHNWTAARSQW